MSPTRRSSLMKMNGFQQWLAVAVFQTILLASSHGTHHRRSMASSLPGSKGGWRPVVGSGGLLYGTFNTAPLHAPHYKIQIPVIDNYASSARPLPARDNNKVTSIAQSYRPTTLRTATPPAPSIHKPINTYHYPFAPPHNVLSHYKYVQNYPVENVIIKNPQNPYEARPFFTKFSNKFNQPVHNAYQIQQLTNVQPIHFGQHSSLDVFGKPVEVYVRPDGAKKPQSNLEIYKPEVYKLPDSESAPQSVSQQVKTVQQQQQKHQYLGGAKTPINSYHQYTYQDFPPSILGTFGSFGVQSVLNREPATKTTYLPPQPTKQTVFNSFGYTPGYKSTPNQFTVTTPKLQTTPNHLNHGSTLSDYKNAPTQFPKVSTAVKADFQVSNQGSFKASPQDPFVKQQLHNLDYNKITPTTYNPSLQTTTQPYNYYDSYHNYPSQENAQLQKYYYDQQNNAYFNQEKKKQIHDSLVDGANHNQQIPQSYSNPQKDKLELDTISNPTPFRATYEVTETYERNPNEHSSVTPWTATPESYDYSSQKSTVEAITTPESSNTVLSKPTTTLFPELAEEFAFVTEPEHGYENSLVYDSQVESQSRRPVTEDFQPISGHKLRDYYYKVPTPYSEDLNTRRKKKPTETSRVPSTTAQGVTTSFSTTQVTSDLPIEALPTLPPNRYFKRPGSQENEKDRIRKRNKLRRRRPVNNTNIGKEEATTSSTRKYVEPTEPSQPAEAEENYTQRPRERIRPSKSYSQSTLTTPSVSTDLTTSALPTISPTTPTLVKKKLLHRRIVTTTTPSDKYETTTQTSINYDRNNETPIMKIGNRQKSSQISSGNEYKLAQAPDYSHKQDEKDTPTSDIAVLPDQYYKTSALDAKPFSFHRDAKPIEAKLEPIKSTTETINSTEALNLSTTTVRIDSVPEETKIHRPKNKNKFESSRPRFSIKDYRNRMSSATSTTEKSVESHTPKLRYPNRKAPYHDNFNIDVETTTERKKFTPKEPRYKLENNNNEQTDKEQPHRQSVRQKQKIVETNESTPQKISSRIRNGVRSQRPADDTTETSSPTTTQKRVLRKKNKDSEIGESVLDVAVTETAVVNDKKEETSSERTRSESAIMKIADKKHQPDPIEHMFEQTKRVSDLTLAASKDYNKPGMFKTISTNSRRIPNYFTIATDDPILPIEAFFPQLNQRKES